MYINSDKDRIRSDRRRPRNNNTYRWSWQIAEESNCPRTERWHDGEISFEIK